MRKTDGRVRAGIIMAGGSGERFWPLSRRLRPKQLLRLTNEDTTMLSEAVARLAPITPPSHTYVVTGEHLVDPIREAGVGIPAENVIAEPCKRNTSGALAYAAAHLLAQYGGDPDRISMAVTTADHVIGDANAFTAAVEAALDAAESADALATLGVVPTRPETGYGYIQIADAARPLAEHPGKPAVYSVTAFHEKPNRERAEEFAATGRFLWNSGMFFWKISAFLTEMRSARPEIASAVDAMAEAMRRGDRSLVREVFEALEDISIDYALMERARNVVVVRADFPWDDVGAWPALDRTFAHDANNNVAIGKPILIDVEDSIIYNEQGPEKTAVAVIGLSDVVVVTTEDAVLVMHKDRAQEVRQAVRELTRRGAKQM